MRKYLELQDMELVADSEINKSEVYHVPHHDIFCNGKIRVV